MTESMEVGKVEAIAGGKTLAEVKTLKGIFQGDALPPLLCVIATMPFNHLLRKCLWKYNFTESQEKNNHQMYINDIKLFTEK